MNTLLVATDFSPAADNAALYAAALAKQMQAGLLLVHVYEMPISMSDVPVMMISAEELKNNAERGLARVKLMLQQSYPALDIKTESRLGDVAGEVAECCESVNPLLVVAGKQGASGIERFLFGTSALSIIRHAPVPVLTVPDETTNFRLQQIALAVDGNTIQIHKAFVAQLKQALSAQLHLVHIRQHREDQLQTEGMWQDLQPLCHTITSEDFSDGIEAFVQQNNIDLLLILPHEHSWMERVFFKTHTAELLEKIRIPILCIPEQKAN